MITTRDPETMTVDERRREVSTIMATGLLRRVQHAKTPAAEGDSSSSTEPRIRLDLPSKTRLIVAQQPVG